MTADTTELQERIANAVCQALSEGEALQCTRVWEAWQFGTMTDEDFADASDGPLPVEIAAAVLPIIAAEVQAASEKAWDEGHNTRRTVEKGGWYLNPYRATETGDQA